MITVIHGEQKFKFSSEFEKKLSPVNACCSGDWTRSAGCEVSRRSDVAAQSEKSANHLRGGTGAKPLSRPSGRRAIPPHGRFAKQCAAISQPNRGNGEGVYDCTPMRDNLSSYVCKKIVKKVDNQQKMIQKGVLLSCSYSRSTMLLPGSDA